VTESKPRSRSRLWRVPAILVAVGLMLVALLPTILSSAGFARRLVMKELVSRTSARVNVGAVSLGWFSGIAIEGLEIGAKDDPDRIAADVRIGNGLLAILLSGGKGTYDLVADASVRTTLAADGSLGLAGLVPPSPPSGGAAGPASAPAAFGVPPGHGLNARGTLELELDRERPGSTERYALRSLAYTLAADGDAGTIELSADGKAESFGAAGTVKLAAKVGGWTAGSADLAKSSLSVSLETAGLRIPAGEEVVDFSQFDLKVTSPALAASITVAAHARGAVPDRGTDGESTLSASVQVNRPVRPDGSLDIHLGNISGAAEARNLPVGVAQPLLAGTGVVLAEDLGPTVDFRLSAPGDAEQPFTIAMRSRQVQLEVSAAIDPAAGAARNATLSGTVVATPATVGRLSGQVVDGPVRLGIAATGLNWTSTPGATVAKVARTATGSVAIRPQSAFAWRLPDQDAMVTLADRGEIVATLAAPGGDVALAARLAVAMSGPGERNAPPAEPNLVATATVPAGFAALRDATLALETELSPALVRHFAAREIDAALPLRVTVRDLDAPLERPGNAFASVAVDATLEIPGEVGFAAEGLERPVRVGPATVELRAADLAAEARLSANAAVGNARLSLVEDVGNLSPAALAAPASLAARGEITLTGLDAAEVAALVPDRAELLLASGLRDFTLVARNRPLEGRPGQAVAATLAGRPVAGTLSATVAPEAITLDGAELEGAIPAALVAELQPSGAAAPERRPVRLVADAPFRFRLSRPFAITGPEAESGRLEARIESGELTIADLPGTQRAVAVRGLSIDVKAGRGAAGVEATGALSLADAGPAALASDRIEQVSFKLAWRPPAADALPTLLKGARGEARAAGVSVPFLERLAGLEPGALAGWTGESGAVTLSLEDAPDGERVRMQPSFPRLSGMIEATGRGESVRATLADVRLEMSAASLQDRLAKGEAKDRAGPRFDVLSGVSLAMPRGEVRFPKALSAEGFSWAGASCDLAIETAPIELKVSGGAGGESRQEVPGLAISVRSEAIERGAALALRERAGGRATARLAADLVANGLLDADGSLAPAGARLDGTFTATAVPTVLVDLLAGTGSTLVRSLGDTVDARIAANALSRTAGGLSATVKAPFADLEAPAVRIEDGLVRIDEAKPVTGSFALSPGVREDLLQAINPVFRDLRLRGERARLAIPSLALPIDLAKEGEAARLDGRIRLDVGAVDLDPSSGLNQVFMLLRDRPAPGMEGLVLPLEVKVERGILRYDDFGLRFGKSDTGWKTALDFKGEVDLTRKTAYANAITTSLPVTQVAASSADVRRVVDAAGGPDSALVKTLAVGVTMFGPLFRPDGSPAELEMKLALPNVDDILKQIQKDPAKAIDTGLRIFDAIRGGGKKN
jgi:hypothetical protein